MPGLKDGLGGGSGDPNIKEEFFDGVRLVDNAKLYFRDTGIYLQSASDGKIIIVADGSDDDSIELNAPVSVVLGEKSGSEGITVKDSDEFPVSKTDSQGNIKYKGKTQRI
jgi:hypothetical protein|tara:strand:+ start:159 stop:488 length:330 start_codon:yes stop_codon:yes gene_type:complete